jgi:GcrA cell cycle regulator
LKKAGSDVIQTNGAEIMGWTEQQIQTLKKMWGHGYSASDIAKNLGGGMTRNAVIGKAHRLKLSVGPGVAAPPRTMAEAPSKVGGSVLSTITKVARKRAMLRPLPSVPGTDPALPRPAIREATPRPVEVPKRSEGIAVLKAGERHCRWPIGDPRSPDFRFCGCAAVEGLPYCAEHARVAYQTVSRRGRTSDTEAPAGEAREPMLKRR